MSDTCQMKTPKCTILNMIDILENDILKTDRELKKPFDAYTKPINLGTSMAILDGITLDVLQTEISNMSPDNPLYKTYEKTICYIKKRLYEVINCKNYTTNVKLTKKQV